MNPAHACLALALAAFGPACASVDTYWHHDQSVDFSKLHTYDWIGVRAPPSAFVGQHVVTATNRDLGEKGLTQSTTAPDCRIVVFFNPEVELTARVEGSIYPGLPGYWGGAFPGLDIQSFRGGSMSVNIVTPEPDSDDRRLLWQGIAVGSSLSPRMTDEQRAAIVDKTVARLLSKFPPK